MEMRLVDGASGRGGDGGDGDCDGVAASLAAAAKGSAMSCIWCDSYRCFHRWMDVLLDEGKDCANGRHGAQRGRAGEGVDVVSVGIDGM